MIGEGIAYLLSDEDPNDRSPGSDFWFKPISGPMTPAGVRVNAESAMRTSAVFACVRIIAETIGSLPLITYRRLSRGKERALEHPYYRLFRYKPNRWQTAMEFIETMTGHVSLRGNAYAEPRFNAAGVLEELIPLHPDCMRVDILENGRLIYLYTDRATGTQYRYTEQEMFHLRGLSSDGKFGLSVIGQLATSIGMSLAAEQYGARFFANDATPGGVIIHPGHFKDKEARDNFRRQWKEAQTGAHRHQTAVLEDGLKYETIGMSNVDAQFLEARKFQITDIARAFRVPLVLLAETEKSTSWGSGIEQFMLAFVTHTIRPWCTRWEQALQRDFFEDEGQAEDEHFVEFLLDALLRGDLKTRYHAYNSAIERKWMLPNEAREKENMNPVAWGDEPYEAPNAPRSAEEQEEAARQVIRKEVAAIRRAYERQGTTGLEGWARRFYGSHAAYVADRLGISWERAKAYCSATCDELVKELQASEPRLMELMQSWETDRASALAQLRTVQ